MDRGERIQTVNCWPLEPLVPCQNYQHQTPRCFPKLYKCIVFFVGDTGIYIYIYIIYVYISYMSYIHYIYIYISYIYIVCVCVRLLAFHSSGRCLPFKKGRFCLHISSIEWTWSKDQVPMTGEGIHGAGFHLPNWQIMSKKFGNMFGMLNETPIHKKTCCEEIGIPKL